MPRAGASPCRARARVCRTSAPRPSSSVTGPAAPATTSPTSSPSGSPPSQTGTCSPDPCPRRSRPAAWGQNIYNVSEIFLWLKSIFATKKYFFVVGHGFPGARCVSGANKRSAPEILSESDLRHQVFHLKKEWRMKNCVWRQGIWAVRERLKAEPGPALDSLPGHLIPTTNNPCNWRPRAPTHALPRKC